MKKKFNKWQFVLGFHRCEDRCNGYYFTFGVFKIIKWPAQGEALGNDNIKGFLLWKKYIGLFSGFYLNI